MTDLLEPPRTLPGATDARRAGSFTDPPRPLPRPSPVFGDLPAPVLGDLPGPVDPAHDRPTSRPTPPDRKRKMGSNRRVLLVAELLAVAAVVAAAVFAMFWASALGERNDALDALEVAVAERDQAIGVAAQAAADLATTEADLTTATADIERLQGELDARTADLAALRAEVSDLTGQVDELTIANADLTASVEQLEAERTAPAPAAESPELVRFVGELVTSVSGPSALTADQQRCIGSGVIAALGLDSVATTVIASATPEAELAVALTTGEAADACGIDRALIFG